MRAIDHELDAEAVVFEQDRVGMFGITGVAGEHGLRPTETQPVRRFRRRRT